MIPGNSRLVNGSAMWSSDIMTSARSAFVKNSLPVETYICDTKC